LPEADTAARETRLNLVVELRVTTPVAGGRHPAVAVRCRRGRRCESRPPLPEADTAARETRLNLVVELRVTTPVAGGRHEAFQTSPMPSLRLRVTTPVAGGRHPHAKRTIMASRNVASHDPRCRRPTLVVSSRRPRPGWCCESRPPLPEADTPGGCGQRAPDLGCESRPPLPEADTLGGLGCRC